jgi:hypothetical protein
MTEKKRTRGKLSAVLITAPRVSAKAAGLRYGTDASAVIRRKRAVKGFTYVDVEGRRLRDPQELQRVKSMGIPPGMDEGLDLPHTPRTSAGHRVRCEGAQAVPLPPTLAQCA